MRLNFSYSTNRWGFGPTTVHLTHNTEGWHLGAIAYTGQCDRTGAPLLYGNFDQDSVAYPQTMDRTLEYVWDQINNGAWNEAEAQQRIQEVADWVTACEKAVPKWPGWN
ncbi:hypothetical protein ASE11_19030 [Hydrogenophaga sp. Root209]|uniref:hypothetical protein n=1 Tax=Hydrogenophaga sp. Root209 TaxID=1736490 RepID=UPI000727309A|nr:hypothetical protein [Hydrogenophaga sp. Root209]KRC11503.1 hypothetical protein ASE11_19030 [Hydrogenophaga sp. Root209]